MRQGPPPSWSLRICTPHPHTNARVRARTHARTHTMMARWGYAPTLARTHTHPRSHPRTHTRTHAHAHMHNTSARARRHGGLPSGPPERPAGPLRTPTLSARLTVSEPPPAPGRLPPLSFAGSGSGAACPCEVTGSRSRRSRIRAGHGRLRTNPPPPPPRPSASHGGPVSFSAAAGRILSGRRSRSQRPPPHLDAPAAPGPTARRPGRLRAT